MLKTKPVIDIGDLVRLKGDENLLVGLGIVLDRREDTKAQNNQAIKRGESLKKFESSGNDVVGGGMGLSSFDPR